MVTWVFLGIVFLIIILLNSVRTRTETRRPTKQPTQLNRREQLRARALAHAAAQFNQPVAAPPPPPRGAPATRPPVMPDPSFQPPYATAVEQRTVRRDQAVIDRDKRRANRTEPTEAPRTGSTAISSTALDTTLVTPYQPSCLFTSTESSLSSSLFDSSVERSQTISATLDIVTTVRLPPDLQEQVIVLLRDGNQVEAVRVVIDQLDISLLEATKAVQAYTIR